MSKNVDLSRSGPQPIPALRRLGCTSYRGGHNVHWMQALHSANKPAVAAQTWSGTIVTVDGDVLTVRKPDGSLIRFRNHDPARLVATLERDGVDILINDQYAILCLSPSLEGRASCFSIQADNGEPLGPCQSDQLPLHVTPEELVARVRTHGGFSIRSEGEGDANA